MCPRSILLTWDQQQWSDDSMNHKVPSYIFSCSRSCFTWIFITIVEKRWSQFPRNSDFKAEMSNFIATCSIKCYTKIMAVTAIGQTNRQSYAIGWADVSVHSIKQCNVLRVPQCRVYTLLGNQTANGLLHLTLLIMWGKVSMSLRVGVWQKQFFFAAPMSVNNKDLCWFMFFMIYVKSYENNKSESVKVTKTYSHVMNDWEINIIPSAGSSIQIYIVITHSDTLNSHVSKSSLAHNDCHRSDLTQSFGFVYTDL